MVECKKNNCSIPAIFVKSEFKWPNSNCAHFDEGECKHPRITDMCWYCKNRSSRNNKRGTGIPDLHGTTCFECYAGIETHLESEY